MTWGVWVWVRDVVSVGEGLTRGLWKPTFVLLPFPINSYNNLSTWEYIIGLSGEKPEWQASVFKQEKRKWLCGKKLFSKDLNTANVNNDKKKYIMFCLDAYISILKPQQLHAPWVGLKMLFDLCLQSCKSLLANTGRPAVYCLLWNPRLIHSETAFDSLSLKSH